MFSLKIPEIKRFFGFNLKTGTLIIGYCNFALAFLLLLIALVSTVRFLASPQCPTPSADIKDEYKIEKLSEPRVSKYKQVAGAVMTGISILAPAIGLIIGVKQNKPNLLNSWLISQAVCLIDLVLIWFLAIIYESFYEAFETHVIIIICLIMGWNIYCCLIIFNYKKEMQKEAEEHLIVPNPENSNIVETA